MPLFQPNSLTVTAISFTGVNNAGPGPMAVPLPGATVGAPVSAVFQTSFVGPAVLIPNAASLFETTISVANQIQQLAVADHTKSDFTTLLQQ